MNYLKQLKFALRISAYTLDTNNHRWFPGVGMQIKDKSVLLRLSMITDGKRVSGLQKSLINKVKGPLDNMSDQYAKAASNIESKIKNTPSLEGLLVNSFFADDTAKNDKTALATVLQTARATLELQINEALDINKRKASAEPDEQPAAKRHKK